jgi:hypothetical protein
VTLSSSVVDYNRSIPENFPGTFVRIGANIAAVASVLIGKATIAMGLRRAPEGWRRTVGILLRSESTRFALSAFGLRVPDSDAANQQSLETRTVRALLSFLAREPDAHFSLDWRRPVTLRQRINFVDIVVLNFAPEGSLEAIHPHLAAEGPAAPPDDVRDRVHRTVVAAYNRMSNLPEVERPQRIWNEVRAAITSKGSEHADSGQRYARRLLSACCISFEQRDVSDPAQRFSPPTFAGRRTLGFGYMSWVVRPNADRGAVDLWVNVHHVGLDGVPLQDLLERLERAWGTAETVSFPSAAPGRAFVEPHPCHVPGERAVDQLITFVDLSPLLTLRRLLNTRYSADIGGDVTVGTLIAWLLAQEPEFKGVRIASTVDVAASGGYDRDVDVVSLRPADYARGEALWGGFTEFAREFNRQIAAARARTSPVRIGMQTAGLLPAWAHSTAVRANPASLDEAFGTLCVTIVRHARVFIAPMTDLGLGHGFFAIGSANLRASDGTRVTAVSVKGDAGRIAHYPAILQRVLERCAVLQNNAAA